MLFMIMGTRLRVFYAIIVKLIECIVKVELLTIPKYVFKTMLDTLYSTVVDAKESCNTLLVYKRRERVLRSA